MIAARIISYLNMNKYGILVDLIDFYSLLATAEKVYGPYLSPIGRKIVIIIDDEGNRKTVSYPKYLMEQHLGVELDPDLHTIDHRDGNKSNDDLSNLQILPRSEHSAKDTRRVKLEKFICGECGKEFERSPRLVRDKSKKGKSG